MRDILRSARDTLRRLLLWWQQALTHKNRRLTVETEMLSSWSQTLEQQVALRTAELSGANAQLQQEILERAQLQTTLEEQAATLTAANSELVRRGAIMDRLLTDLQVSKGQMEEERRWLGESNKRLEESYAALKRAHQQLLQAAKMESVGRLAAGVAHEVKNPLAILLLGSEYLTKRGLNGDIEAAQVVRDMREAALHADEILRGLLQSSAPQDMVCTTESLNAVVEQTLAMVKPQLFHLTVVKECADGLPLLSLDRRKIVQVFANLFLNAAQAMPTGGTLTVRTYLQRLTSVAHDDGARTMTHVHIGDTVVMAEVEDTGPGIPTDQLVKIFDPFFTTKPAGQGTGLGLTVAQKMMSVHGGLITIDNRAPHGVRATLTFTIPQG